MKKLFAIVLALVMVLSLAACGGSAAKTEQPAAEAAPAAAEEAPAAAEASVTIEVSKENPVVTVNGSYTADKSKGSVLVTSVGQSADASTMETILKKAGVDYTANATAGVDDLDGVGTVIVVAGASTKGLGAAGISTDDELARADELLAACKEKGIDVVMTHIGGSARRGSLSDQFTQKVMENADYMLVVADGDTDGFFSAFCATNGIPLTEVLNMASAVEPLGEVFA